MLIRTKPKLSHTNIRAAGKLLRVWLLAVVILMTGVTQSGFVTALLGGGSGGGLTAITGANAAPGGDLIFICTADGVRAVSFGDATPDAASQNSGGHSAGHGFCSLCASHHGAMVNLGVPFGAPVSIIHDAEYAQARLIATTITLPRTRYSRAPPYSI
ncbi:DUF2946 family protein [Thalassospira xianhensis]|uniref:DUF2946 domain-containing protein n=1 Tax=Thalassospira xianhensis MCCC 1A02616 TaxID=1177929 RepID=A0A367UBD6_9PROT|nr:DUF2946 family protein [Thalassospira xianhensis]RCK05469.1 hypothetical protein TH5_13835 [Thalassospira xianhensis MCCC 1A02616]